MTKYFIITGLPRSRTAWMANLFCSGKVICFHELRSLFGSFVQMTDYLETLTGYEYIGLSDASVFSELDNYISYFGNAPFVIIKRDVDEVIKSFVDFTGINEADSKKLIYATQKGLIEIEERANYLTVNFEQLNDTEAVKIIWEACTEGSQFDEKRCEVLQDMEINQCIEKVIKKVKF